MNNGLFFRRSLGNISKLVCISPSQVYFWKKYLSPDKISLIPHGLSSVDTTNNNEDFYTVCVGYNGRDYDTLVKAMEIVGKAYPDFKCHIVRRFIDKVDYKNIVYHEGITDSALKKLYENCLFVTLPLEYSTANNTILEAVSHRKPLITTDLLDTRYYLSSKGALFTRKNDYIDLSDKIINLIRDKKLRMHLSQVSESIAEILDWSNVSKKYLKLYHETI